MHTSMANWFCLRSELLVALVSHVWDQKSGMQREPFEVCGACGLSPKSAKPLLRCTRCKSVFYHDKKCQRAHYRIHRKVCRDPSPTSPVRRRLDVVYIEGKGQAVRAGEFIAKAQEIAVFEPLVPPVLIRQRRQTHCALCFDIVSLSEAIVVSTNPKYPTIVCSHGCKIPKTSTRSLPEDCVPSWLTDEVNAVARVLQSFYAPNSPVEILPTAILIFRIELLGIKTIDEMQSHEASLSKEGSIHYQAISGLVQQLFLMSYPSKLPSPERITLIHNAIKYNSFSIVSSVGEALGIGLYQHPAYRINHSCVPNTRQTFTRTTLHLYANRDIASGEEICISYCDADNAIERRQFLKDEYCFNCRCQLCSGLK